MFHSYLSALSESSNSALQVLLQGENRLELWLCKKPFFPEVFLLSCSVFLWNSRSSSSVREMQFSLFSEFSLHISYQWHSWVRQCPLYSKICINSIKLEKRKNLMAFKFYFCLRRNKWTSCTNSSYIKNVETCKSCTFQFIKLESIILSWNMEMN